MHSLEIANTDMARRPADTDARLRAAIAVRLLCREDLDATLAGGRQQKLRLARKLAYRMERERQKGLRGHSSYDLNRHIGLRQALDLLVGDLGAR